VLRGGRPPYWVALMVAEQPAAAGGSPPRLTEQAQAEFHAALAELAQAAARTYYDAAADALDADRYYAGVDLDHLAGLVVGTHRDRPRYQPATQLYPWVDLQPDGTLRSLYTGHRYDPAQLITEDFRIAGAAPSESA
jgi:hypothetical protein